jgi:hypothetical protein
MTYTGILSGHTSMEMAAMSAEELVLSFDIKYSQPSLGRIPC